MPSKKLIGIQAARGAAAFLVAFYHAGRMLSLNQYLGHDPFRGAFNFGHAGVDFFFVLSGFIIYYVHHQDIGRLKGAPRYAWRRVARIYPIYWLVTAFAIVVAVAGHHTDLSTRRIVASLLLLPQASDPIVGVAWTLEHEVLFYAIFATLIVSRRFGMVVFGAWAALIFAGLFVPFHSPLLSFCASDYHIDFFLGIACAALLVRGRIPSPVLLAVLGLVAFLGTGVAEDARALSLSGTIERLMFGMSSWAIIAGLAAAERRGAIRFGAVAEFVGGASYSLYLIHTFAIGLTAHALAAAGLIHHLPARAVLALCLSVATVAASGLYALVEKPMLSTMQKIGRGAGRNVVLTTTP